MSEDWEESIKLNLRELSKVLMFAETHKFFNLANVDELLIEL